MKHKNIILSLFICITFFQIKIYGQEADKQVKKSIIINFLSGRNSLNKGMSDNFFPISEKIEGSHLLLEKYGAMEVMLSDSSIQAFNYGNYDILNDQMIVLKNNQHMVLSTNNVLAVKLNNSFFTNIPKIITGKYEPGLYEVLLNKPVALLRKHRIEIYSKHSNPIEASYHKSSKLSKTSDFYNFKVKTGELSKLPRSKNKFFKTFGTDIHKIKKFIEDYSLDHKKEEDMIKVYQYYNKISSNN